VGKTRIAGEVASRVRRAFTGGVCLAALADLDAGAGRNSVAGAVLAALSVSNQSARGSDDALLDFLRDRQLLVVLDNCEHLLEAAAKLVVDMLAAAPAVRILATSREALGIAGEQVCLIPPLATPDPDRAYSSRELRAFESVTLLLERACAVDPRFAITSANAEVVAQLCAQLDGMPLAIELAATRLRSLSVAQMVRRLENRFSLLSAGDRAALPRQRSLRAVIDWSYDLCTPPTRLLWNRLAVFPASFDIDAAEAVCGFGDLEGTQVFEGVDRLVAQSVLLTDRAAESVRYRLPATVREYAAERLVESGELGELKRRQRDYFLARATAIFRDWAGPAQVGALREMHADHANLVSALRWSAGTEGEHTAGIELATMLCYHWLPGGFLADGRRWLELLLAKSTGGMPAEGDALWVLSWVTLIQGDREGAARHLAALRLVAEQRADPGLRIHVWHWTALYDVFCGRAHEAVAGLERAVSGRRERGDHALELTARFMLAYALVYDGRLPEALEASSQAVELSARRGERFNQGWALWTASIARWKLGDRDGAERDARAVLEIQREFQDRVCAAVTVAVLAWVATSRRQFKRAAELAAISDSVCTDIGTSLRAFGPRLYADAQWCARTVAANLGEAAVASLARTVRPASFIEAIDRALDPDAGARVAGRREKGGAGSPLTSRELEVARLVALGLSNRAVAERLVIAPRTADGHVQQILSKLGVNSRARIATWVVERDNEDR
jgi:predicted ATPase/DNA-binding CsgD family transcriptional regulator